jgi:hypothetical protein
MSEEHHGRHQRLRARHRSQSCFSRALARDNSKNQKADNLSASESLWIFAILKLHKVKTDSQALGRLDTLLLIALLA